MSASDPEPDIDVLVVGAGPVGSALAVELARRDASFRVIDRSEGPAETSRALGTQARTREHLRMMGSPASALEPAVRLKAIAIHDGTRDLARLPTRVERPDVAYDDLLIMLQGDTERILQERLAELEGAVERRTALTAMAQDDRGVVATLTGPGGAETVRARYLVGCDGAHSSVRHHLRAGFDGVSYAQSFLLADCRIGWDRPRDEGHAWLHPDGVAFVLPLPEDGRWRVMANAVHPPAGDAPPTLDEIAALLAERTGEPVELSDATWLSHFRMNRRMVDAYRHGRVFLAGDAAHIHTPVGGQGMNTGIQDAVNLGWKLELAARGRAAAGLLDTYGLERMPVARGVLDGTDRGFRALMLANPVLRWLRDLAISVAADLPAVRAALVEQVSELGVSYRRSPLAGPSGGGFAGDAPRPGDRAPQAALLRLPDHAPDSLFDRYATGAWTLLLFPDPARLEASVRDGETLGRWAQEQLGGDVLPLAVLPSGAAWAAPRIDAALDPDGAARRLLGVGTTAEAAVLVRPDGYVGYRSSPIDAEGFWSYLRGIFAPGLMPDGER